MGWQMTMPDYLTRADAIAFGFVRYFTGEPCMWGPVAERYVIGGRCLECARNPTSQCSARELKRRYDYIRSLAPTNDGAPNSAARRGAAAGRSGHWQ